MRIVTALILLGGLLLPSAGANGQSQGGSQTNQLGSMSMGSLTRIDSTRPAEQAQLMSARNTALLATGVVDPETYILGPGDLLGFEILGAFSMSGEDVVGADGHVTFSQIGTFAVGGMTLSQARRLISGAGADLVRNGEPRLLLKSTRTFKVQLTGLVVVPGSQPASFTTRVSELVQAGQGFLRNADIRNIQIIHQDGSTEHADLLGFLMKGRLDKNPTVRDGDVVLVNHKTHEIELLGAVLAPGKYSFVEGDELGDLLEIVGMHPRVELGWATLQRYSDGVHWDTLSVDLRSVVDGITDVPLQAGDRVLIRAVGDWHTGAIADVRGAVRFPGPVPIVRHGVTVRDAIDMAGGPLDDATLQRVILGRPFLPDSTGLREADPSDNFVQAVTRQRLHESVVDLRGGARGPVLDPGDIITVPRYEGWVEVLGQVKHPGFYDYHDDWKKDDYIKAAGGWASFADKDKSKVSRGRFGDVAYLMDVKEIAPGDIIFVPERPPFNFWAFFRDALAVTAQAAALIIIVRDATR